METLNKKPPSATYAHRTNKTRESSERQSDAESSAPEAHAKQALVRKQVTVEQLPGPEPRPVKGQKARPVRKSDAASPPSSSASPTAIVRKNLEMRGASPSDTSEAGKSAKARRLTEDERKAYFESEPNVSEIEPHRALCKICGEWVSLHQTTTYSMAPWTMHKRSCGTGKSAIRSGREKKERNSLSTSKDADLDALDDDASSVGPSVSASEANSTVYVKRRSLLERKRVLESDPLTSELRESEVFCTACDRWIKLSSRTKFELKKWNAHITREHGRTIDDSENGTPSDRVQEAERRLRLINDVQARDVSARQVTCVQCSADISLHDKIPFHLDNWLAHKASCPYHSDGNTAPLSTAADTTASDALPSPSRVPLPPPSVAESTTSREAVFDVPDGAMKREKRPREEDGEEEADSPIRRVRTRVSSVIAFDKPPSGPWGWLKLPWETFKRGFAEGLGVSESSTSSEK